MADILLIHGAAHGAWCWRDVLPPLRAAGHSAQAIDLPGHGADSTPLAEVTLETYVRAIEAALPGGPALVLGHSMAGFPITALAARRPERLAGLIYLCAYVPTPGLSLGQMRHEWPEQPLVEAIRRNDDGLSMQFDPAMIRDKFYHDCPEAAVDYARDHLCDQPLAPMQTPVDAAAPQVPRDYIVCAQDRAIPPGFQRQMCRDFPPDRRHELPVSHSPFFTCPEALAALIDQIARRA